MRQLRDILAESLLDDEDDLVDKNVLTVDMAYEEFMKCRIDGFPKEWLKINEKTGYVDIYPGGSNIMDISPMGGTKLPEHVVIGDIHGIARVGLFAGSGRINPCWFPKRCGALWLSGRECTYVFSEEIEINSDLGETYYSFKLPDEPIKKDMRNKLKLKFAGKNRKAHLNELIWAADDIEKIKFINCDKFVAGKSLLNEKNMSYVEEKLSKFAKNIDYNPILNVRNAAQVLFKWDKKEKRYKYQL